MNQPSCLDDPWCRYIPQLHRLLADPSTIDQFPSVTREMSLDEACAVWETLHYLLKGLLGWDDPGAGLVHWYAAGQPVDDSPLLALASRIWGRGGLIDDYAAWTWTGERAVRLAPHPDWWREYMSGPPRRGHNAYFGGYNPLHLGHSDEFGYDEPDCEQAQLNYDKASRRAVLIVNHLGSWRRDLQRAGEQLPELGDRSWHVEVFDRQTGYLGLYRRSRVTGNWFQGKHSVHLWGHALVAAEVTP